MIIHFRHKIGIVNSWLLALLIFSLPISTSLSTVLALLIILLWLIEGDFSAKFATIRDNHLSYAILAYTSLFVIGLLWTEDLSWGIKQAVKQWKLILFFPLLTVSRREHFQLYIGAFIAAMTLSAGLSFLIRFELIQFRGVSALYPVPFNTHISYNPLLAFAIYLLQHCLFSRRWTFAQQAFLLPAGLLMIGSMFITTGRTGQAAFFILLFLMILQRLKRHRIMGLCLGMLLIPALVLTAYQTGPGFRMRTDEAIADLRGGYRNQPDSSPTAQRLTFAVNSVKLFTNSPWFGVGTGDFPGEYKKINTIHSPSFPATDDPHNHYLLVLCQFGIFGLLVFLSIFWLQIRYALSSKDEVGDIRLALPVFYLSIMLGGTYLLGHELAIGFAVSSALLFGRNN